MTLEVLSPTAALLDGRYLLSDRVGRGGMATVYRAEDTHLGRTVAIKMIHEDETAAASADRAHNEKALLAAVNHRALVTLYDAQLVPGRPRYLVMEFVDGPTLAKRMATGRMRPRQVARLVRDLAEGLSVVHASGIVHRDVKPSNILLARDQGSGPWTAKLADFGIACTVGSPRMTSPGIVLGTLTYMSPEQLRDLDPGTEIDIFALGLVALEALTGSPAYPALGSGREAAVARVMQTPEIPDGIDDDWRDLLERMTRLEPSERPNAAEVARAARGLLLNEASDAVDTEPEIARGVVAPGVGTRASAEADGAEHTAVLPRTTPTRTSRTRNRVTAGAALLVAVGAVVAGVATAALPAQDGGARTASVPAVRTPVEPVVEPVVVDAVEPEAPQPIEIVNDDRGPGTNGKGNNGNGNNGNGDNGNGNNGKGDKGNDGKGKNG